MGTFGSGATIPTSTEVLDTSSTAASFRRGNLITTIYAVTIPVHLLNGNLFLPQFKRLVPLTYTTGSRVDTTGARGLRSGRTLCFRCW